MFCIVDIEIWRLFNENNDAEFIVPDTQNSPLRSTLSGMTERDSQWACFMEQKSQENEPNQTEAQCIGVGWRSGIALRFETNHKIKYSKWIFKINTQVECNKHTNKQMEVYTTWEYRDDVSCLIPFSQNNSVSCGESRLRAKCLFNFVQVLCLIWAWSSLTAGWSGLLQPLPEPLQRVPALETPPLRGTHSGGRPPHRIWSPSPEWRRIPGTIRRERSLSHQLRWETWKRSQPQGMLQYTRYVPKQFSWCDGGPHLRTVTVYSSRF